MHAIDRGHDAQRPSDTALRGAAHTPHLHRTYTAQFKAELIAACQEPGASIAALALQHGINTNVLHRWLKEWQQGLHRLQGSLQKTEKIVR